MVRTVSTCITIWQGISSHVLAQDINWSLEEKFPDAFFPSPAQTEALFILLSPELNFLSIVQVKPFRFGLQLKLQPETSLLLGRTIKIFVRRWNQDWDVQHTGVRIKTNVNNSSFLQRKKKYRFEMALRTSHFSQMKESQWKFHYCIPLGSCSTMAPTLLHQVCQINQLSTHPQVKRWHFEATHMTYL